MLLHKLTKGGPANFTQDDVDYCCHPKVRLLDLAEEAVRLNSKLVLREAEWTEIGVQLTLQTLYQTEAYLVNHIASLHADLAHSQDELASIKHQISTIQRLNNATS